MKVNLFIFLNTVVFFHVVGDEAKNTLARSNNLRNFYNSYEQHERFLRMVTANDTVYNTQDLHKIRHGERHKLQKLHRCRRYAQIYYGNYENNNCYYRTCRYSYCGYCPTSNCRRRCPYVCPNTRTTSRPTPPAQKECNCDPEGSKFQACDTITGQCKCKPYYKGLKCDQCEVGFWKNNSTICTPCNCDKNGSIHTNCDPKTGTCLCKPGVEGRKCDFCKPRHYGDIKIGCKACDPCNKPGHICHPKNGKCVCPPLTKGSKCERCVANAWGHEPDIGCKACECSVSGSSKLQCDPITGRCTCKLGFEGEKCDRCSYGYHGYKNCRKCNCDKAGTLPEDCMYDSCKCEEKGCRCKAKVEGKLCDHCKKGTFGIDPDNPLGCIDCFCFGRSNKCKPSPYIWDQIRTNEIKKDDSRKCVRRIPCWILPDKFTGDLTQSYGGYLRISLDPPPNLVYLVGNGITLESTVKSVDIKMTENQWRLKYDSDPPKIPKNCTQSLTRPCFMTILQNVTRIQIDPERSVRPLKFKEILLDTVSQITGLAQAISVENCECPKEYTSPSCQDVNNGYYKYYPNATESNNYINQILGIARPCECNGRSNICDKQTGYCFNCSDFTTGPHCEFCAEGYYKGRSGQCSPCLCPSENQNFAKNCTIAGTKPHFVCECKTGYIGIKCNKCDNGFWGDPQEKGGSCKRCNCNLYGSETGNCDKSTGQCVCKLGFTGIRCSECMSARQVIQDGRCTPCDECTQILFYTLDNLAIGLNKTLDLFQNGIGPPWGMFNSTIHKYNLLTKKFDNIEKAKLLIKNANLPELENRVEKIKHDLPKRRQVIDKQMQTIEGIQNQTKNISHVIGDLNHQINDFIKKMNDFGKSHVDTKEALREAKDLLAQIKVISEEAPSQKYYTDLFTHCNDIFANITNIYGNNKLKPEEIKSELNKLKKKISNLNSILNETDLTNKLAKSKNKQNANRIVKLNQTIHEIASEDASIKQNISEIIEKITATNDILADIETVHRILSTIDLEKATKDLDQENPADVYETLTKVSEHVKNLQNKIKTYKELFNFTKEEWKKIDASSAYDNLVKGIEEANKTANEAENITLQTKNKLFPLDDDSLLDKTELAQAFSDRLEKRINNLPHAIEEFNKTKDNLLNLKDGILDNGKNNNEINAVLRNMLKKIRQQSVDTKKMERVKEETRNITDLVTSIEQNLRNTNISIQYELIKTYSKYLDLVSKDEIAKLMKKMNLAKKELQNINVNLNFTKFDEIKDANENKLKNRQSKLASIQSKIDELKNKIQYANERVEAVEHGVNIGNCRRHYKLENAIFRSLEIHFKCSNCNLFNLTNSKNQTILIKVLNNQIQINWKSEFKTFPLQSEVNTISLQRTSSTVVIAIGTIKESILDREPFQIETNHTLQVGGLTNSPQGVCLRKIILNGQAIGLWKFAKTKGECSGCYRNNNNDGSVDVFFNGNGYRIVTSNIDKLNPSKIHFKFSFATFDENSLIFIAQDKVKCSYIALNLKNGYIKLQVKHDNGASITLTSENQYNNGEETKVEVSMAWQEDQQTYALKMTDIDQKNETRSLLKRHVYKIKKSNILVGGISTLFNKSCMEIDTTPFLGNLKMSGDLEVTDQNTLSYNIAPRVDPLKFYKTWFYGTGFIELEIKKTPNLPISFSLRPINDNDSFVMTIDNIIDIFIENSSLKVKRGEEDEESFGCISANSIHIIEITQMGVSVNNEQKNFTQPFTSITSKNMVLLYLGKDQTGRHPNFIGSISDIFINNEEVPFNKSTIKNFENIGIGRDDSSSIIFKNKCVKEMQNTETYLRIPNYKTDPEAFKFGDKPNSFIYIKSFFMGKKFVLEFQFRTYYPTGLLFIASSKLLNKNSSSYLLLEINNGDVRLRVQGHKPKTLTMPKKINDGIWHHVYLEQIPGKKKWRVIIKVDKLFKLKERVPRNSFKGELYVGGVANDFPVHRKLKNELHPFRGCIRSLRINRNLQVVKNNNNVFYSNIGQCFQNVEEGAYFGGDAYATYKNDFKVNKFLELSFDFKTSKPNGILLTVSNSGNSPALSVELQNGAVVMTIDMGNGVISKVTNGPHSDSTLANNEWHNITALYSSSELTVNVDGIRKSWVQSDINSLMDEIEAPLYVGGLPLNAPSGTLKIKENFRGCIRKFKIEDTIMDWTDMRELNNVQLNSCLA